ncbi:MAG: pilus assembly protein TadG-related protein [Acidobacteriota bacterium]|nr:pilus assembly protein TadG-related protein [Acidobacteriota bacterium]
MSHAFNPQSHEHHDERGSIMVMTAVLMLGLVLAIGLCIDVARIYMARAEMQKAADAAALSAARELNSGTSGIDDAVTRANSIANTQGFGNAGVGVQAVEFADNVNGPFLDAAAAQAVAENIRYVQVTTEPVTTSVLFAVKALGPSHVESRKAIAGMSVGINGVCDFFPVAVALTNPDPAPGTVLTLVFEPDGVLLDNNEYVILNVSDTNGNNTGDTVQLAAGGTSACMSVGSGVPIMPGADPNQLSEGVNTRYNADGAESFITFEQYKNGSGGNDRRILIIPIVTPGPYTGNPPGIIKWGAFFLMSQSVAGSLQVEWIEERLVIGSGYYIPGGAPSSLSIPVLYR